MSSLEWVRVGALLTLGALVVVGASKVLVSNARRLWRRFLPARFHGDYCHCDGCMRREAAESEISGVIARLREKATEIHNACDTPGDFGRPLPEEARTYLRGKADALDAFAGDLIKELDEREGSR